ncbi:MAG: lipocalin family protein [Bdellovibrionales bacterium]
MSKFEEVPVVRSTFFMSALLTLALALMASVSLAQNTWPRQPTTPDHPGSNLYSYELVQESFRAQGRQIDIFRPNLGAQAGRKIPVLFFGHGQALDVKAYDQTFRHLARKGILVAYLPYDTGFFDQDWVRMAQDYRSLAEATLKRYENLVQTEAVVYAGHSKGAYIAVSAAGVQPSHVKSVVLLAPAGFEASLVRQIRPDIPVSIFYGESDNIIERRIVDDLYAALPSQRKQFVLLKDYPQMNPELKADHFVYVNKRNFLGGRDGLNPFHYHGQWKWLIGATQDLQEGNRQTNPYLYGEEALTTGLNGFVHQRLQNRRREEPASLESVRYVDVARYVGRWYQQAANPLPFSPLICSCAQQSLTLRPDGRVNVYNSCVDEQAGNALREIRGVATVENPGRNSQLSVDFGLPQKGQYWVIGLDPDYRWAVVSEPSRRSLFILSKTPVLEESLYQKALELASRQVDLRNLLETSHEKCEYPSFPSPSN